eukprot:jgi/Orpsp1_1/1178276/evm.model.c7180000064659.1
MVRTEELLSMMEKLMITKLNVDQRFDKFQATGNENDYDKIILNFRRMNHPHFNFVNHPDLTKTEKAVLCAWILDIYNANELLLKMKENGVIIIVKEGDSNAIILYKPGHKFKLSIYDDTMKAQNSIDDYRRIVYAFNHIPTNGKHSKAFYDVVRELRKEP